VPPKNTILQLSLQRCSPYTDTDPEPSISSPPKCPLGQHGDDGRPRLFQKKTQYDRLSQL